MNSPLRELFRDDPRAAGHWGWRSRERKGRSRNERDSRRLLQGVEVIKGSDLSPYQAAKESGIEDTRSGKKCHDNSCENLQRYVDEGRTGKLETMGRFNHEFNLDGRTWKGKERINYKDQFYAERQAFIEWV